jgi:hypothetical protein
LPGTIRNTCDVPVPRVDRSFTSDTTMSFLGAGVLEPPLLICMAIWPAAPCWMTGAAPLP